MPSFRMLPHGSYSLIPAVFTTMGWLASLFQDGCDYARLEGETVALVASNPDTPYLEVGFAAYREPSLNYLTGDWNVVYTGMCLVYPDDVTNLVDNNAYWKVAKSFDFVATVLGGAGSFFLWFATCCVFSRGTWRWAGYEVLLAAIFQALSFLWFLNPLCTAAENTCTLYWGAKADIIAAVFWFIAALFIFCHYPTVKENNNCDGVMFDGSMDPSSQRRQSTTTSRPAVTVQEGQLQLSSEGGQEAASPAPSVMTEGDAAASISKKKEQELQQPESGTGSTEERSQMSGEDSRQDASSRSKEASSIV